MAVNIAGYAFFGREPFSFVDRVEKRFQFTDNLTFNHGNHTFKTGFDYNYLPLDAQFTVNFGGLFNFGGSGQMVGNTVYPRLCRRALLCTMRPGRCGFSLATCRGFP